MQRAAKAWREERTVHFAQSFFRKGIFCTKQNAIGMKKVLDSSTLPEKLRVSRNTEANVRSAAVSCENVLELLSGLYRHSASKNNKPRNVSCPSDLGSRRVQSSEV